jgi:hypothetical protein
MSKVIYGSEVELAVFEPVKSSLWLPRNPDHYMRARPETLARLLYIAADLAGTMVSPLERVHLMNGMVVYIDGKSLEFASPPCASLWDLALHEQDYESLAALLGARYREEYGEQLEIYKPGAGDRDDCGYHENYGLPGEFYFRLFYGNFHPRPIWDRVLVPFLVSRIILSGGGGFRDNRFVISPRAAATTHVYHRSTDPQRPIVHLKRPRLDSGTLRVQLTCGDMLWMTWPTVVRFSSTGVMLMAAAAGLLDHLDFTLDEPVSTIRDVSQDFSAPVRLTSGQQISAIDLQDTFAHAMMDSIPQLQDIAPDMVAEAMDAWSSS